MGEWKIKLRPNTGYSRVELNGEELHDVVWVTVFQHVSGPPTVQIGFDADSVELDVVTEGDDA
jgi:hypothetical protein